MWIALLTILLLFAATALYLLLVPVILEVDTRNGLYRLRIHWLVWGRMYFIDMEPWVEVKIAWWIRRYNLLEILKERGGQKEEKEPLAKQKIEKGKVKSKRSYKVNWHQLLAVLRSFKVEEFSWALDTHDYALNAKLYPILWAFGFKTGHNVRVNFQGENYLVLTIKNKVWRVIKAFLTNNK